jgi:cellulose synthase/poly-beta-1,6-N-acetylglucosamine synthase-like glycosyltransferase
VAKVLVETPVEFVTQFFIEHLFWVHLFLGLVFGIGVLQNLISAIQLPAAFLEMRQHTQAEDSETNWQILISEEVMPMSILVPAYNEAQTIVSNIRSMLFLQFPDLEIIVANDGSTDQTLQVLIDAFDLKPITRAHELTVPHAPIRGIYGSPAFPQLVVIDKENGGCKADAVNAALNLSRNPLYCVVDADSLLEPESLLRCIRPFMEEPEKMVAVGGTIRVLNGCTVVNGRITKIDLPNRFLPLVQTMEYIRSFLMARLAWSHWGMLSIVSGAFGVFRRDLSIEVGGWANDTIGEDYDFIVKLHRYLNEKNIDYEMQYVPAPVCWTEAPETLKVLKSQRTRWQRGALEVAAKNKDMLFNPKFGRFGMLAMPNNLLVDVIGPVAEIIGYIALPIFLLLGVVDYTFALALIAIFFIFGIFISVSTLILEELELARTPRARDLLKLGAIAIIENFGYRQLNSWWRIVGWWQFLRNKKGWGEMPRVGAENYEKE